MGRVTHLSRRVKRGRFSNEAGSGSAPCAAAAANVAYLFGDNWFSQTAYKILALVMLFIGGLATYTFVWELGDIGVGLMTVFNMIAILPMGGQAVGALEEYMATRKK